MSQSYRIRTELGVNKTINIQLDQEFEFLEILSLKIQQSDIYTRSCADYGVVVGRVTANNGLGIPNARVAVFIPITDIDQSNPLISSIYPYNSPSDKNEDGFRYNLLPYERSYSKHSATGTLPTRSDVLTGATAVEIFDTYYKYTAKTNESGDYMIMGVPLGEQTIVMDVDLSDIGEFSLTPQDLIRIGAATEAQVAGSQFRSSNDLNSLPQIVGLTKNVEVSPLWGDPTLCLIAINRLDFDLRDDANIDIQPTSVFMGSIFSTPDNMRIRRNCKPRDNMGNLCGLTTGPGQILAIRQTIQQDDEGNPVLEQYQLEQSGNVIDGNGTWLVELPMNLDYIITNEFGENVVSNDPSIGIPTKGKYRFKIKWSQPNTVTEVTKRPYFLVPNVKEYGWRLSNSDPSPTKDNPLVNTDRKRQQQSSYYFGLAWSGYTNGFTDNEKKIEKLNEAIECEDTFYQFNYNKVYTVSGLIAEYKNGNRGRFLGIKEIDSQDCDTTVNKFPTNDGFRNFDLIFFLFSIIFQVIQLIGSPILIIYHFLAFLWNNVSTPLLAILIGFFLKESVSNFVIVALVFPSIGLIGPYIAKGILYLAISIALTLNFKKLTKRKFGRFKIPMITYPECTACECTPESTTEEGGSNLTSLVTQLSNSGLYFEKLLGLPTIRGAVEENRDVLGLVYSQAVGTRSGNKDDNFIYKSTESQRLKLPEGNDPVLAFSKQIPLGERINVFNTRKKYFDGVNRISVSFDVTSNLGKSHLDNTITILMSDKFQSGDLLTFVNPESTTDVNYLWSASTTDFGIVTGISGEPLRTGKSNVDISYAVNQTTNQTLTYFLSTGSTESNYKFPLDIEYYQVITAITVSNAQKIWTGAENNSYFPSVLGSETEIEVRRRKNNDWIRDDDQPASIKTNEYFEGFQEQYITILQRGVDPYSPKYVNQFGLGKIFGYNDENRIIITASTRLNVPIQRLTNRSISVQKFNQQSNIFYPSYFFKPGIEGSTVFGLEFSSFTTSNVGYYGALDADYTRNVSLGGGFAALTSPWENRPLGDVGSTVISVVTKTSNGAYDRDSNPSYYDLSEDLSGCAIYSVTDGRNKNDKKIEIGYYSPNLYPTLRSNPMLINSKTLNVMRTDRLPSSDVLDSSSWEYNPALLQQNMGFGIYLINTDTEDFTTERFGSGGDTYSPDLDDQIAANKVIESFDCINMVGLTCYSGNTTDFGIKDGCKGTDTIELGCYVFMEKPLTDLSKDLKSFAEWGYRFRFFYGLCRGVLAQSFVNNWVNGALYTYPIQVNTTYDVNNQANPPDFCRNLVYFESNTNNFYYRSSPYNDDTNKFIGKSNAGQRLPTNKLNLLYPTTIIDLGMKDYFYSEIMFDPSTKAYVMNQLDNTSYSDMSDLVNLFVISRITDEGFLRQIFSGLNKNNSLDQLFTRDYKRIDGDLAQLMSINSEEGVTNFSPEYYSVESESVVVLSSNSENVTMGVFFSSTTEDLQFKDYLTPGRINFRGPNNQFYPYPYGIKTQEVPFYQWILKFTGDTKVTTNTVPPNIFGSQYNTWATGGEDIFSRGYQSLDRLSTTSPGYFKGSNIGITDTFARGYIFNTNANSPTDFEYSVNAGNYPDKFLVGAPFHFYFGVVKGESALDRFKTKYSLDE